MEEQEWIIGQKTKENIVKDIFIANFSFVKSKPHYPASIICLYNILRGKFPSNI